MIREIPSCVTEGIEEIRKIPSCITEGIAEIREIPSYTSEWTKCKQDVHS